MSDPGTITVFADGRCEEPGCRTPLRFVRWIGERFHRSEEAELACPSCGATYRYRKFFEHDTCTEIVPMKEKP